MKKLVAAIFLGSLLAASLASGIVAAGQRIHKVGKIGPSTVAPNSTSSVMGSLTQTDVLSRLKLLNLKPTTIGGAAHFDVNHLYVNEGDFMEGLELRFRSTTGLRSVR